MVTISATLAEALLATQQREIERLSERIVEMEAGAGDWDNCNVMQGKGYVFGQNQMKRRAADWIMESFGLEARERFDSSVRITPWK